MDFPKNKLSHFLDHDNHENRAALRKFLSQNPLYTPRYNISLADERELALERLKGITQRKFISVLDFERNPLNIFAG